MVRRASTGRTRSNLFISFLFLGEVFDLFY